MIGDAAVYHSAPASLAFEPDCLFRGKNPFTPPSAVGDFLLCKSTRLSVRQAEVRVEGLFWADGGIATFPSSDKSALKRLP